MPSCLDKSAHSFSLAHRDSALLRNRVSVDVYAFIPSVFVNSSHILEKIQLSLYVMGTMVP
jgi:hypothetical protein